MGFNHHHHSESNTLAKRTGKAKKSRTLLRFVQLSCLIIFCIGIYVGYQVSKPLNISPERVYNLEQGANVADFAQMLADDGYIDHVELVIWISRLGNVDRQFKAGEYRFEPEFNLLRVLDRIVKGEAIVHSIQFIEGWTFNDFLNELQTKSNITQTLTDLDYEGILDSLEIPETHPEGWFFPDTYNYNYGQSDASILRIAYNNMNRILHEEWDNRRPDLPYKTAYESLIVASIIQKESYVISEYPIIAGVIVNRLRKGMRLQMDPTVIYGLGGVDGPLRKSQLAKDTAYNTYTRHGLPPTPIAMPGLLALRAAANPADTEALYFVSQGDGTHKFSNTLEEHLNAVRAYRRKMNQ